MDTGGGSPETSAKRDVEVDSEAGGSYHRRIRAVDLVGYGPLEYFAGEIV